MKLFLQKNAKFSSVGGSDGWGLCPQTPSLRRLGALPPDPHWPPAGEGSAPRPLNQPHSLRISGYAPARKGCPRPHFFCVLGLEPCVLDSTSADLSYELKFSIVQKLAKMAQLLYIRQIAFKPMVGVRSVAGGSIPRILSTRYLRHLGLIKEQLTLPIG